LRHKDDVLRAVNIAAKLFASYEALLCL